MSRPAPRRSSLSGSSPIAPPPAVETPSAPASASEPTKKSAKKTPVPTTKKAAAKGPKPKVSFYTDKDDADRARGAYRATSAQEGHLSWSDFLAAAVLAETERLEAKYNGGKPFMPVAPGGIPAGRPMGE